MTVSAPDERWRVVPRAEVARRVRTIVITFVVSLVLGYALVVALGLLLESGDLPSLLLFPPAFALIVAGVAGLVPSFGYGAKLQSVLAGDWTLNRTVRRAVLRRKTAPLTDEDLTRATRWASIYAFQQPLSIASITLNFSGLAVLQLNSLLFPSGRASFPQLPLITLAVFVLAIALLVPTAVVESRRARAFAVEHQHLLVER